MKIKCPECGKPVKINPIWDSVTRCPNGHVLWLTEILSEYEAREINYQRDLLSNPPLDKPPAAKQGESEPTPGFAAYIMARAKLFTEKDIPAFQDRLKGAGNDTERYYFRTIINAIQTR